MIFNIYISLVDNIEKKKRRECEQNEENGGRRNLLEENYTLE